MAQTVEDIMQADRDFNQMAQEGEVRDAFLAYAAGNAIMMNGGQNFIRGEGSVHEYVSSWPDGIRLSWAPLGGMMAESGDLGFTYGTYVSVSTDEDGNDVESHGKYTTIWQRQDDGSWKFVMDGGNPSPGPEPEAE
jgi:ketosteroid isomerase-like protein